MESHTFGPKGGVIRFVTLTADENYILSANGNGTVYAIRRNGN